LGRKTRDAKLFLTWLPEIQGRAWAINHQLSPTEREEAVAEVTAWSWAWMLASVKKGRLQKMTPRTMAVYGSRMFHTGRRFAAGCSVHDAMSEIAQASGKVSVENLGMDEERSFAILRPLRTPKPLDIARCNHDYGLVAEDPELSGRAKEVFQRLVRDHDHGCFKRIAEQMGVTAPYVTELNGKIADSLSRIGYAPTSAGLAITENPSGQSLVRRRHMGGRKMPKRQPLI
jgi:hypothetical protein